MNVWIIQTGEQLPIRSGVRKMRTAVLADKLLERGHSVLWWASTFEHQRKVMIAKRDRNFNISERYTVGFFEAAGIAKMFRWHVILIIRLWL